MARYQLILAYDGTNYLGFQRQADGVTIQGEVETALRKLNWKGSSIVAAGRTDRGVHARGQVVAFDLDWGHSPADLGAALNANLPADIAVQAVTEAAPDFHPRYDARSRRYQYHLYCQAVRDPLRERFCWRVWPPVDVQLLERATSDLIGRHNFAAFGTPTRADGGTLRTVMEAGWRFAPQGADHDELIFDIRANSYLYHMVRRLVYFLVAIGQGKAAVTAMQERLQNATQGMVQGLAPAHGLVLVDVQY